MKKLFLFLSLFILNEKYALCQSDTSHKVQPAKLDSIVREDPLVLVEQMPEFPGGDTEMQKFIMENFHYPKTERRKRIGGTIYIGFVVEKDGSLSEITLLRGVKNGPGLDKEALRVVEMMPKWKPGKNDGRLVSVRYNLPIRCMLR